MTTKEGARLSVDSTQLVSSLFALLPIPVAILDDNDAIVVANSFFRELFPESKTLRSARTHEIVVPGRGTFDLEILPLNDQGFQIVYGVDISKEVSLRRQLSQMDRHAHPVAGSDRERVPFDLNDLIRSVVSAREPYTRLTRIAVSVELASQLPSVKGHSEEIEKVLIGLVTNAEQAILFAQRRTGAIHIKTWAEGGAVRMSVCDNGCGIATRDTFAASIDALMRGGGQPRPIGIGLCAEVIKDHGGELFCWSSYDSGSTYTMELPAPVVLPQLRDFSEGNSQRLAGRYFLLIDDDVDGTAPIFDMLIRHGAKVDLVLSTREALSFVQSLRYDLIICGEGNHDMPGLSSDRYRRVAESLAPGLFQRILFVTAADVNGETRRVFAESGIEFIRRPFISELLAAIELLLSPDQPQPS